MSESKKKALQKKIQESSKISDQEKSWIEEKYLPSLKRKGVKSTGTQANYLQSIRKLLEKTEQEITEVQELDDEALQELNEEVADNIQASNYRESEGGTSKRRKSHLWTTWKRALQVQGVSTRETEHYIPSVKFKESGEVNRQADTRPEDLPTPDQAKQFIQKIGELSGEKTSLRNQALILLLWDKGPRIGEALGLKMKHVHIQGKTVKLNFEGEASNKGSSDRTAEMFQGRKTFRDYIEQHPKSSDSEAYVFADLNHGNYHSKLSRGPITRKVKEAAADFDFKVFGEPFHIWRKAMITSQIVNGWASWEEVCTWHGKSPDSTKPDYLKIALSDVDAKVAEAMGIDDDRDRDEEGRMKGDPHIPVECRSCEKQNRCYQQSCQYCETELPDSKLPKGETFQEEHQSEKTQEIGQIQGLIKALDASGVDIDQEEVEKYL